MKAFLYVGGTVLPERITQSPTGNDLVIAVDSGIRNARMCHANPSVFVGDCDSFPRQQVPDDLDKIILQPEKDLTDTQAAVQVALDHGATEIYIIGGLSGRLDHTLSNLAILERLNKLNVPSYIEDGCNRVRFLKNTSTLLACSPYYQYLGLICLDDIAKGIEIQGCKYPLKNGKILRSHQFAISNELTGNCALINVKKGALYIVESADPIKKGSSREVEG